MRTIEFSPAERELLKPLLHKRLESMQEFLDDLATNGSGGKQFEKSNIIPMRNTINQLSISWLNTFSTKQKRLITGCLNEKITKLESEVVLESEESWLTMSPKEKDQLLTIDACKDMLQKCGYFSERYADKAIDRHFRYSQVFDLVHKLKKSDKILLAGAQRNDCYRVTFVSDTKEFCDFEIKYGISLTKPAMFRKLNGKSIEELAKEKSSLVVTRIQARNHLLGYNRGYDLHSLAIMQNLLSD